MRQVIAGVRPGVRWSIRTRLTALFVAIFGSTLVVFCSLLYNAFIRNDQAQFDVALYNHAVDIAQSIEFNVFGDFSVSPEVLGGGGKIFPFSIGRTYLQILDARANIIARSTSLGRRNIPVDRGDWETAIREGATFRTLKLREIDPDSPSRSANYRLCTYFVRKGPGAGFGIQVAVPLFLLERTSQALLTLFLIGVPLTLLIAAMGGLYLSRKALAPVNEIISKARSLSPQNLSERITVPPVDDEFRRLSKTLNALLDRLESAFRSQERFVADASHELKTPLAILRGELDVLQSRPRSPEEISQFLGSAGEELQALSRTVEDLLLLARVDAGASTLHIEPLRFDELALDVVSRLEKLGRSRNVKIRFDLTGSEFDAQGDPDLLKIALKNLIENAIKFSPEGAVVELKIASLEGALEATVSDEGPGVPPEMSERIFDRFFRLKQGSGGSGLGLAIARRIVELHGGSLSLAPGSSARGATFRLRIKKF